MEWKNIVLKGESKLKIREINPRKFIFSDVERETYLADDNTHLSMRATTTQALNPTNTVDPNQ
uniref:Uncharacterized protein n=1 Tax=Romanomermis culicivorax TaxID=13658 RepID=A0A915KZ52_ROMCU